MSFPINNGFKKAKNCNSRLGRGPENFLRKIIEGKKELCGNIQSADFLQRKAMSREARKVARKAQKL